MSASWSKGLSRIIGISTALPAALITLSNINCVLHGYRGRPIQKAILASAFLALLVDGLIYYSHMEYLLDEKWKLWPEVTVGLNVLKRLHSVADAYLVFMRWCAVIGVNGAKRYVTLYTVVYTLLGSATHSLHVYSYATNKWTSSLAYASLAYRLYRVLNVITVAFYALLAVWTDVALMHYVRSDSFIRERFKVVEQFYSLTYHTVYELITLAVVMSGLLYGYLVDDNIGFAPYVESLLLALISLNASYSVKAAAVLPNDTTSSTRRGGGTATLDGGQGTMGAKSQMLSHVDDHSSVVGGHGGESMQMKQYPSVSEVGARRYAPGSSSSVAGSAVPSSAPLPPQFDEDMATLVTSSSQQKYGHLSLVNQNPHASGAFTSPSALAPSNPNSMPNSPSGMTPLVWSQQQQHGGYVPDMAGAPLPPPAVPVPTRTQQQGGQTARFDAIRGGGHSPHNALGPHSSSGGHVGRTSPMQPGHSPQPYSGGSEQRATPSALMQGGAPPAPMREMPGRAPPRGTSGDAPRTPRNAGNAPGARVQPPQFY